MNLIEIAEDLKDVPDQYLMQEVQQPTGNFPAYLVISELSRRKRMRDKATKEMPTQTVAEELAMPPQMAPQMAPQGLMAMPQAQTELAAQDAMGTTPTEMMMPTQTMAGGGIVSFRDGGDIPRFQNQGFVGLGDTFGGFDLPMGDGVEFEFPNLTDAQKLEYIQGRVGYPQIAALREGTISLDEIFKNVYRPPSTPTAPPRAAPRAAPAAAPAGAPPAPEAEPAAGSTFRDQISQILSREPPAPPTARYSSAGLPAFSSAEELGDARARKIAEFEKAVPDRATRFFEEDISRREKDIEGRRASNINDALIQAGLGAMRAKPKFRGSAGLFEVIGEGGQAGFDALRQGRKDINQSEEALRSARAKMIDSQTLRDQGKFGAGKEARLEAKEDYDRALALSNTKDSQNFRQAQLASENYRSALTDSSNRQRLGLEALKIEQEARLNPLREQYLRAQIAEKGRLKAPTDGEFMNARISLSGRGIKPPYLPEQLNEEVMRLRGMSPTGAPAATGMDYNQAISGP